MKFSDLPEAPVPCYQNLQELGQLWTLVASRPHARVLEIGSLYGGTLWYWSHLPEIELLVSLDLVTDWQPTRDEVLEARRHWPEWFPPRVDRFVELEADSHDVETAIALSEMVTYEHSFDFLLIDGDHSYEGVREDWMRYSLFVRPGGLVAFHDTWPNYDRHEPGVVRWVDELRHHLPSIEWTDPDGVGIVAFEMP